MSRSKPFLAGCSLVGLILASAGAMAGNEEDKASMADKETHATVAKNDQQQSGQEQSGPQQDVQEAAEVLNQLKQQEPELAQRLGDAKGVFVIPDYATASLLVGGSGGEGVLLTNTEGQWGNPGFYDIGNIDVGVQAGAAAGSIVLGLMNDAALETFRASGTEFALTAEAGLTIINWSAQMPATTEEGDVVVWSDTEGLLAEASVGVGGISWDEEEAREYYGQEVQAEQVLAGNVQNPHQDVVQSEFAAFSTGESSQTTPEEPSQTTPEEPSQTSPEIDDEIQPEYEPEPHPE